MLALSVGLHLSLSSCTAALQKIPALPRLNMMPAFFRAVGNETPLLLGSMDTVTLFRTVGPAQYAAQIARDCENIVGLIEVIQEFGGAPNAK